LKLKTPTQPDEKKDEEEGKDQIRDRKEKKMDPNLNLRRE